MREGISIEMSAADRGRLERIAADRNSPQKHVWRARIILATAQGCGTAEIMRRAEVSKPCVWRWQERFMREGVAGLLRDQTRKPGLPPLPPAVVDRVVALTLGDPPGETTHWTGRAMAAASGVSLRSVQRIWAAHGLQPHRVKRFKLSTIPRSRPSCATWSVSLDPPAHSLVLSVDEKSQIQALDRTQPGLPIKKGRAGTMTHDYIRHGTTTLFAALNVLDGKVIGQCMARHRDQEFIRFLNRVEATVPAGKLIHAILDNYAAHKHPKVRAWLTRHPLDLPLHADLLLLGQRRRDLLRHTHPPPPAPRRLHSLVDLQAAINGYLEEHNQRPKPFVWTADPDRIIEKVNQGHQTLASDH